MAKRLTENHPTWQKVEKIFALMEELGITIERNNYYTTITDKDHPEVEFMLKDSDSSEMLDLFPPFMEYKIIIED